MVAVPVNAIIESIMISIGEIRLCAPSNAKSIPIIGELVAAAKSCTGTASHDIAIPCRMFFANREIPCRLPFPPARSVLYFLTEHHRKMSVSLKQTQTGDS